jgi:hypothetical protein
VVCGDVRLDDPTGTDDGVLADAAPPADHHVVGRPDVVLDRRVDVRHLGLVDDVVVGAVDVHRVGGEPRVDLLDERPEPLLGPGRQVECRLVMPGPVVGRRR